MVQRIAKAAELPLASSLMVDINAESVQFHRRQIEMLSDAYAGVTAAKALL